MLWTGDAESRLPVSPPALQDTLRGFGNLSPKSTTGHSVMPVVKNFPAGRSGNNQTGGQYE